MVESEEGNCTGFRFQPSKQRRKSRDKNKTKGVREKQTQKVRNTPS